MKSLKRSKTSLKKRANRGLNKRSTSLAISDSPFLGGWNQAPKHSQDNEFIKMGYRVNFNTVKRIIKSLFMFHNESMNIWSHLVGAVLFLFFISYIAFRMNSIFTLDNFLDFKRRIERSIPWNISENLKNFTDEYF